MTALRPKVMATTNHKPATKPIQNWLKCPEQQLWRLTALAYNLKRVLNLVSFEKLMLAVGVKVPQTA